ncbi:M24 family metallopeptidase [Trujillonella humicola]|uniref:M24 family metallopeptidase n=1 Tax=Trujillonella humicola TaxID=3383699 RepID=UPI003905F6C0
MQRIARLRALMAEQGLDAVVLTTPHNVLYAAGYTSILEKWQLQEPLSAAIVPVDPDKPVVLAIPEANLALLMLQEEAGRPDRAGEVRVFDMINFCEVMRSEDPAAAASTIGKESVRLYGERVRGACEPDILSSIRATLTDHGLTGGRIGFDDLRVMQRLAAGGVRFEGVDALETTIRSRMVKTPSELETFRRVGKVADASLLAAADALQPGVRWDEVQYAVAQTMIRMDATPVDEGAMMFGGTFQGAFLPELFRTRSDRPLDAGQVVILETQGVCEDVWIDINRTAVIGQPTDEYQHLHDTLREAFEQMVAALRPGNHTGDLPRIAHERLVQAGIPVPDKLLVLAHGIGHQTLEFPFDYPAQGRAGAAGFEIEENMVLSLDCLYFGGELGPCHMENVYIVGADGPENTYSVPLQLLGPR